MQMCGNCMKVYDESEYAKCPFCSDDKDEYTHFVVFDKKAGTMGKRFPDVDWWCDRCNAYLNGQTGFDDNKYIWECTECGHKNSISAANIYESEEDFRNGNK